MSLSALITLITSWLIVGFFTVRFFVRILKSPGLKEGED